MKPLKEISWGNDVGPIWLMHAICVGTVCATAFSIACPIWFATDPRSSFHGTGEAVFVGILCGCFYGAVAGVIIGSATTAVTFAISSGLSYFRRPKTRSELSVLFDEPITEAERSISMARHYIQHVEDENALKEIDTIEKSLKQVKRTLG